MKNERACGCRTDDSGCWCVVDFVAVAAICWLTFDKSHRIVPYTTIIFVTNIMINIVIIVVLPMDSLGSIVVVVVVVVDILVVVVDILVVVVVVVVVAFHFVICRY